MSRSAPLIMSAPDEARKTAEAAISSGSAKRPVGISFFRASPFGPSHALRPSSVRTTVGEMEFSVTHAATGRPVHPVFSKTDVFEYVGRNSTPGGFFAFAWDGTRMHDNGKGTLDHRKFVPDGAYRVNVRALKALGDAANPAHWQIWTSPVVTIDRP